VSPSSVISFQFSLGETGFSTFRIELLVLCLAPSCIPLLSPLEDHSTNLNWRKKDMKFMTTWSFPTGNLSEAAERFLAGAATPEAGVTLLGRWHNVDCSGGYALYETNDPVALYKGAVKWGDLLELTNVAVIEDADAGQVLAALYKK
jgi:hypothetical protein